MPMALYKHVANKEDLLDGMIELVVGEIEPTPQTGHWKQDVRARILAARRSLEKHAWSRAVLESRSAMTPAMLAYLNGLTGLFLDGGLTADLTHHVMHALGNRMWGFSQELFAATPSSDPSFRTQKDALPTMFPHLAAIAGLPRTPTARQMVVVLAVMTRPNSSSRLTSSWTALRPCMRRIGPPSPDRWCSIGNVVDAAEVGRV